MGPANPESGRAYYRLRYPPADRPTITVRGNTFEVSELSEKGARIIYSGLECPFEPGQPVYGPIQFHDDAVEIESTVLRVEHSEFVIQITEGITYKRMVEEQLWVHQKYPMYFAQTDRKR